MDEILLQFGTNCDFANILVTSIIDSYGNS